ncbi:MAG: hypothetical protein AAF809_15295, partial [Bacteroidota bacterium]
RSASDRLTVFITKPQARRWWTPAPAGSRERPRGGGQALERRKPGPAQPGGGRAQQGPGGDSA